MQVDHTLCDVCKLVKGVQMLQRDSAAGPIKYISAPVPELVRCLSP
jgi:hypothetical protein